MIKPTEICVGVLPYSDSEDYRFEVEYRDGQMRLQQGSDIIMIADAEWPIIRDAIERVFAARVALTSPVRGSAE
jgi:hypothetical protein